MRRPLLFATVVAAIAALTWFVTPSALEYEIAPIDLPADLDAFLLDSEAVSSADYGIVPGAEKRIRWQEQGQRTRYVIVYLHGFSATRQEVAPLAEILADALGANLFETRLRGHGHTRLPMDRVRAEDWLQDGAEALAIAEAIGDEIIVLATSTGATLALAMAGREEMQNVRAMVFISPNLGPRDSTAEWLTRPAGPLIARAMIGETRTWTPHNEQQARFWTTSYPIDAAVEVMRLTNLARSRTSTPIEHEVLVLLSPNDQVVSPDAARAAFAAISSPRKQLIEIDEAGDPSNHVLAGDILSPGETDGVAAMILEFLQARPESNRPTS